MQQKKVQKKKHKIQNEMLMRSLESQTISNYNLWFYNIKLICYQIVVSHLTMKPLSSLHCASIFFYFIRHILYPLIRSR